MDNLYKTHIIWSIYYNQKRQLLIKTQFRNLLKLTNNVAKFDSIVGRHLQAEVCALYRQKQHEKNIEAIRKFLEANKKNEQLLKQLVTDFETRSSNPSHQSISAIRNAYLQSGQPKNAIIKSVLKENSHSLVTIRESLKENFIFNLPITEEMRKQLLKNTNKYSQLYSNLFKPCYYDFIEPNKPLLFHSED